MYAVWLFGETFSFRLRCRYCLPLVASSSHSAQAAFFKSSSSQTDYLINVVLSEWMNRDGFRVGDGELCDHTKREAKFHLALHVWIQVTNLWIYALSHPTGLGGVGGLHFINSYNFAHFSPRPLQFFPSPYALILISLSSVCDGCCYWGIVDSLWKNPSWGLFYDTAWNQFFAKVKLYLCGLAKSHFIWGLAASYLTWTPIEICFWGTTGKNDKICTVI